MVPVPTSNLYPAPVIVGKYFYLYPGVKVAYLLKTKVNLIFSNADIGNNLYYSGGINYPQSPLFIGISKVPNLIYSY